MVVTNPMLPELTEAVRANLRAILAKNEGEYLIEAWADGYISRMTRENMLLLKDMEERGLLVNQSPCVWVLSGSGVYLTWQIIRYFQANGYLRRQHRRLVDKYPFLDAVPDVKKRWRK